jgi:uncharacterized protein YecE (DUF72 family)
MTARAPVPIRVGTAGWSYEDWKGIVYPSSPVRGFDPLAEMASLFDTNEINSTFYRIPAARTTREWSRRVAHNPRFAFTAKLFRGFTHERTAGSAEEAEFLAAMEPLAADGRLGAVLVQFPVSFHNTSGNRRALASLLDRFSALPLAAEFRHATWNHSDALTLLAERDAAFVNIDQPWLGDNLRATDHVAAGRAYYRFHGRNAGKWFGPDTSNAERYDYLYSERELRPAAERIAQAARKASEEDKSGTLRAPGEGVSAILNNHFRGQAVANAIQLQHLLTGELVAAPESLRAAYSALGPITEPAASSSGDRQGSLFRAPEGNRK